MDYINQLYRQFLSRVRGAKIRLNRYSDDFVILLNKKLGAPFIKLHKINERYGYICCIDERLKHVTVTLTNKYIDSLIAKTHANFIRILNEKSWGVESTSLKALKFANFAEEYYMNFERGERPIVTRKVWCNYFNGHNFSPSRYMVSYYNIYWRSLLTSKELKYVISKMDRNLTFNQFCTDQFTSWTNDAIPYINSMIAYFKQRDPYQLIIDNFGIRKPVKYFPAIVDVHAIANDIKVRYHLTEFQKNIIAFKGAQIFRWVCNFTCIIISENTPQGIEINGDIKKSTDDLLERTRDILERHSSVIYELIVTSVQKLKISDNISMHDKRIPAIIELGNDPYKRMGKDICLSIEEWISEIYEFQGAING